MSDVIIRIAILLVVAAVIIAVERHRFVNRRERERQKQQEQRLNQMKADLLALEGMLQKTPMNWRLRQLVEKHRLTVAFCELIR